MRTTARSIVPLLLILCLGTAGPGGGGGCRPPRCRAPRSSWADRGYFPWALKLKDGRIAVVLRGGAAHVGIKGRLDVVFSSDDGKTWTKPAVVVDSPTTTATPRSAKPPTARSSSPSGGPRGTFKDYAALDDAAKPVSTWVTRSSDGGRTWSDPAEIDVRDIGYGSPYGKMITLPDGTMLMNIYGYGVEPAGAPRKARDDHSHLYRSADGGKTWSRLSTIGRNFNETGLLRLTDGTLLAAMRSAGDKANVSLTRSADGGNTWAEPEAVTGAAAHPADLVQLPDNRVLMAVGYRAGPFGVRRLVGDDQGNFDWEKRTVLNDDSTNVDTGYPSSVVLADGRVLTVYYAVGSKAHPAWGVHCAAVEHRPD